MGEHIQFKATVRDIGTSYVITIPKPYVENGPLQDDTLYNIKINIEPTKPNGKRGKK